MGSSPSLLLVVGDCFFQCLFESREISVTTKAPESVFRFHKCQGHPLMPLRRVMPVFHVAGVFLDVSHQALDAVGRRRALPKLVEEAKSVEREGVLPGPLGGSAPPSD